MSEIVSPKTKDTAAFPSMMASSAPKDKVSMINVTRGDIVEWSGKQWVSYIPGVAWSAEHDEGSAHWDDKRLREGGVWGHEVAWVCIEGAQDPEPDPIGPGLVI